MKGPLAAAVRFFTRTSGSNASPTDFADALTHDSDNRLLACTETDTFNVMENDNSIPTPTDRPSNAQVQQTLRVLDSDRAKLAERVAAPWWLHWILGVLVAGFVASTAVSDNTVRSMVAGGLVGAAVVVTFSYQKLSGIRVRRTGSAGVALVVGLVAGTLLLLSVAYGLAASLSAWWVLAPAVACFAMILGGSRWFDRIYRERLADGR